MMIGWRALVDRRNSGWLRWGCLRRACMSFLYIEDIVLVVILDVAGIFPCLRHFRGLGKRNI